MRTIIFQIPGEAVPKKSAKFFRRGKIVGTYPHPSTAAYEKEVAKHALIARVKFGKFTSKTTPLKLDIFVFRRKGLPTSKSKLQRALDFLLRPITTPDATNYAKSVEDGIKGVLMPDDGQVVDVRCRKYFAVQPRVIIVLQAAVMSDLERRIIKDVIAFAEEK